MFKQEKIEYVVDLQQEKNDEEDKKTQKIIRVLQNKNYRREEDDIQQLVAMLRSTEFFRNKSYFSDSDFKDLAQQLEYMEEK